MSKYVRATDSYIEVYVFLNIKMWNEMHHYPLGVEAL